MSTAITEDSLAPLHTLVRHTAWANRQLFAALGAVPSFAERPGAPLIVRALDHIQVVARIFRAHLERMPHRYTATASAVAPPLDTLDRSGGDIDRWYIDATARLSASELAQPREVRFTDGRIVTMTPATMILHVMTHTIHHRGNVDAIMIQSGIPRRRDGVPEFLSSDAA